LKAQVFKSIDEVPQTQWDALLGERSITFSHRFWSIIEQSRLNDFDYRHVLFSDDAGQPVALTSFYSITTDIAIFAPAPLRKLLTGLRRVYPNLLKFRMLECGTPIILNSPPFVALPSVTAEQLATAVHTVLADTARREGQFLTVIRDFEAGSEVYTPLFAGFGYHWADLLPNTYLEIRWQTAAEYQTALKSYYRSKLRKHLKRNAELGVHHTLVTDFADLADTLCAQWMVVHEQADEFQREVLTPDFYRALSERLDGRAKVLLFHRGEALVGHALLLHDGQELRWLYFGRETAVNDSLYLYVAHAVIETAIALKVQRLEMGLTTYPIKQDLGAQVTPIRIALRARSRLINFFVGLGYAVLNRPPKVENRAVFKVPIQRTPAIRRTKNRQT